MKKVFKKLSKRIIIGILALLVIVVPLLYLTILNSKTVSAAWFDDFWAYRTALTINNSGSLVNNQKVKFDIDTAALISASKMQSDCDDSRFTDINGNVLKYYLDSSGGACNTDSTDYYVLVPTINANATIIYHYYGNPTATIGSQPSQFSEATFSPDSTSAATEEKSPGPVAYWQFDDGTGTTTKDASSNTNTGTLGGATVPTWQTEDQCVAGKCLYFDGASSKVTGSVVIKDVQTISFWVRPNTIASQGLINLDGGTHKINTNASGVISAAGFTSPIYYLNGNLVTTLTLVQNQWNFVTITTATGFDSNSSWTVGTDGTNFLKGFFDEVKVSSFVRTADQIKADYAARGVSKGSATSFGTALNNNPNALNNGLVGYWKLDETSGSRTDSSGNGNTLTDNNTVTSSIGKYSKAGQFTAANSEYLSITDNASLSTGDIDFTVAGWIYADDETWSAAGDKIVTKELNNTNREYRVDVNANGQIRIIIFDSSGAVAGAATWLSPLSASTWYFFAAWHDAAANLVYIQVNDGTPVSGATTGVPSDTTANFMIGAYQTGTLPWNGRIDEARVYKRVLSAAERTQLYNFAPGPVGYWDFENGTSTTAFDRSGNGNSGTWNGTSITPRYLPAKYGVGGNFNGTDNYLATASNVIDPSLVDYTAEAWFKLSSAGATHIIFAQATGGTAVVILRVTGADPKLSTNIAGTNLSGTTTLLTNTWYHGAVTKNGTTVKLYLNGIEEATGTRTSSSATGVMRIGTNSSATNLFPGTIDEARVYNYVRTQKQIIEDMNAGHPAVGSPVGSALGHWKFNEGYGTTANNSGNGGSTINGTLSGMASPATSTSGWTQAGNAGRGLVFDGSDDFVAMPSDVAALKITSDITVSAWVNLTSISSQRDIICKYTGTASTSAYCLYTNSSGKLVMAVVNATGPAIVLTTSSATLSTATWYHVAGVFSSANSVKLYINGSLDTTNTTSIPTTLQNPTTILDIGAENAGSNPMNGYIDEPKIYSYALTADEVKLDYNQGSAQVLGAAGNNSSYQKQAANQEYCVPGDTTSCAAPVGRWDFEENIGSTVNDKSGNANTSTWNGTLGSQWAPGKVGGAGNFNGTDNYVETALSAVDPSATDFTASTWFQVSSLPGTGNYIIIQQQDGTGTGRAWIYVSTSASGNFVTSILGGSTTISTVVPTINTWYHVAVTKSGTTIKLYVNGVLNVTSTKTVEAASGVMRYGSGKTAAGYLTGKIDGVRIYNYARTPAQIAWDYNKGAPMAQWKFDECQGITLNDSSGNSNTGTWSGLSGGSQTSVGTCPTSGTTAWYQGRNGKVNSSLYFDGTDDYVDLTSNLSNLTALTQGTFTAWVKVPSSGGKPIFSITDTTDTRDWFWLNINSSMQILTRVKGDGADHWHSLTNSSVTADQWAHIAVTAGPSGNVVYINAVAQPVTYTSGSAASTEWFSDIVTSNAAAIGRFSISTSTTYTKGQIDDVRIYNYPLTSDQVKILYTGGAFRVGPVTGTP